MQEMPYSDTKANEYALLNLLKKYAQMQMKGFGVSKGPRKDATCILEPHDTDDQVTLHEVKDK